MLNNLANALPAILFLFFVKYILDLEDKTGFFLIVYFFNQNDFLYFIIICIFIGMCLGVDMALPSSIQSDVA